MKVHVIVSTYQGVVDEVRATLDEAKAEEIERKVCEEYGVPFDREERKRHYEENLESNEVFHYELEAE